MSEGITDKNNAPEPNTNNTEGITDKNNAPEADINNTENMANTAHALKILKDDVESEMGFNFVIIEDGLAVSELDLQEYHFNPYGVPYGGVLFTMADDTAAIAFMSAGGNGVTINGHVDYLRGSRDAQKLICTAKVRKAGRRIFYIDAGIVNEKYEDLCRFKFVFLNIYEN